MAGATTGRNKRKLTTVEQDLLPIEELVNGGRKSTFLNVASMEAGTVHDCHAAHDTIVPSVVISFMVETGNHDGAAEDFVDVALVHHAGVELLLEDNLSLMSLFCDVVLLRLLWVLD
ncbi:hypothetical protein Peur_000648 [Populus x canadensis]